MSGATSAISRPRAPEVANLLRELAQEMQVGLLLISHDLGIVRHVADVVAVMYLGVVVETGPTREVWA